MTLFARYGGVGARQRKPAQAMIEGRSAPTRLRMTALTRRGKPGSAMVRIRGLVEICNMATKTVRRRSLKDPTDVTGSALDRRMSSHEHESCLCVVVELCRFPSIQGVTRFAIGAESGLLVIDAFRIRIIFHVAGDTSRAQTYKSTARRTGMTGFTRRNGVGPRKGEAVRMFLYRVNVNIPTSHGMAIFAGCAKLAPVDIRVA